MAEDIQSILTAAPIPQSVKADAWDAYHAATSADDLAARVNRLPLPKSIKADLWDAKSRETAPVAPVPSAGAASQADSGIHPLDATLNTIKNWWDTVHEGSPLNLYNVGKGLAGLATGETEKAMGATTGALWAKAKAAFDAKDYGGAAVHTLNYLLSPIIGDSLDRAGEKFARGDISGGIGDTLGTATNLITAVKMPQIAEAVPKTAAAVANAPAAVRATFRANPETAMNKALVLPKYVDPADMRQAIADVRAAETEPVTDNESLLRTIPAAKSANRAEFQKFIDRTGDATVSGAPILAATVKSIPETMWTENPEMAQKIIDGAKGYSQDYTGQRLAKVLEEKNGELNSFYRRAPGAQQAAVQSGAPEAVVKAQRDAAANTLYNFLDPENKGAGPRNIQTRWGIMDDLEDAAYARRNPILREQAVSPGERAMDIGKAALSGIGKTAVGAKIAGPFGALLGAGDTVADVSAAMRGKSDALIRRAFANIEPDGVYVQPGEAFSAVRAATPALIDLAPDARATLSPEMAARVAVLQRLTHSDSSQ
jgi:hypothetical protein